MINHIVQSLSSVVKLKQVVVAGGPGSKPRIDTAKAVSAIAQSAIPNTEFLFSKSAQDETYAVLNLVSSTNQHIDKYRITQTDVYVCSVRSNNYKSSLKKTQDLIVKVDESNYGIEVTDIMQDHDKESQTYRNHLEITFTVPATGSSAELPAALVYLVSEKASPSSTDNRVRQQVGEIYGVILLTASGDMNKLKSESKSHLIGQSIPGYDALELIQGDPLENEGGLEGWRYLFSTSTTLIQQ